MDKELNIFINADIVINIEGEKETIRKSGKVFKVNDKLIDVLSYFNMEVQDCSQELHTLHKDKTLSVELKNVTIHSYAYGK